MSEHLILVDARNRATGRAEKHAAHTAGLLHRAFSIFLVNESGQLLLQRRHPAKYHSGGLWANACCGHPRPGERTLSAAKRRLVEELGAEAPLTLRFFARYRTHFPNGLIENEIVHVYFGPAPKNLRPNPDEVTAIAWGDLARLRRAITDDPSSYAFWFRHYLTQHLADIEAGVRQVLRARGRSRQDRPPSTVRANAAG